MNTQTLIKFCSKICVGVLLISALQVAAFAASDSDRFDNVNYKVTEETDDYTYIRIYGPQWDNEWKRLAGNTPSDLYTDPLYDFENIPKEWVIKIRDDKTDQLIGYYVVIPVDGRASFSLSGTDFESVRTMRTTVYSEDSNYELDNGYGDPVYLTEGKTTTFYHVGALKIMLRDA